MTSRNKAGRSAATRPAQSSSPSQSGYGDLAELSSVPSSPPLPGEPGYQYPVGVPDDDDPSEKPEHAYPVGVPDDDHPPENLSRAADLSDAALREAAGKLLLGDPRPLQALGAHPCAFEGKLRELLEALAMPLHESKRLEDTLGALEAAGRPDLAGLLIGLAGADALSVLERPWESEACKVRQDSGKEEVVDLLIERLPMKAARQLARSAASLGASVFERRRP